MKTTQREPIRLSKERKLQKAASVQVPNNYPFKVWNWLVDDLSEYLSKDEVSVCKRIAQFCDVAAYQKLSEDWSLQSIGFSGMKLEEIRAKYLLSSLLKKYLFESNEETRRSAAIKKFLEADSLCKDFNNEGYKDLIYGRTGLALSIMTYAPKFIQNVIGTVLPEPQVLTEWSRHGPGANLGTKGGNNSMFFKYKNWPYPCTRLARRYALELIQSDERWYGALEESYRAKLGIPRHLILNRAEFHKALFQEVPGNRIDFVPKTSHIDRSIAIEPDLNLQLQLGVDGFIRRNLKRWGIDLDDQSKNQFLAKVGSKCGKFSTLDLAAASDTISIRIIKLLFPPEWYDYLMCLRSPCGTLDGEDIIFQKISSMGNGFTFAIESLVFAAIIYAVFKHTNEKFRPDAFAVFGDDLIVPNKMTVDVISALELCGFAINTEKSFYEGYVRESCGSDWLKGFQLRPVFFSSPPQTVTELFSDINRLGRKLELFFGKDSPKVTYMMKKWIPQQFRTVIGPLSDTEFDSYLHQKSPNECSFNYFSFAWQYKRLVWTAIPQFRGQAQINRADIFPFQKGNVSKDSDDLWLFGRLSNTLRINEQPFNYWTQRDPSIKAQITEALKTGESVSCELWSNRHVQILRKAEERSAYTIVRKNAYNVTFSKSLASFWQSNYVDLGPTGPGVREILRTLD